MQTSNSSWKKLNMDTVAEAKDIKYPPPLTSIIRWAVESDTSQLVSYYILKTDNMEEIVEWADSAPIFTNRLSFEIRQLTEDLIFDNAEVFVVEEVVLVKEKLMQEGSSGRMQMAHTGPKLKLKTRRWLRRSQTLRSILRYSTPRHNDGKSITQDDSILKYMFPHS